MALVIIQFIAEDPPMAEVKPPAVVRLEPLVRKRAVTRR